MSKFDKIFEAREEGKGRSQDKPPVKKKTPTTAKKNNTSQKKENGFKQITTTVFQKSDSQGSKVVESAKQRGRPPAKRSDPNYLGFTTYIRRDTHLKAKIALLQEGKNRELSELVESLLVEWLEKNNR
jgi:hypothetical protein